MAMFLLVLFYYYIISHNNLNQQNIKGDLTRMNKTFLSALG